MSTEQRDKHNQLQTAYFEKNADFFLQDIPQEIQQRTASIVRTAGVDKDSVILDVGTGAGVLIGHFLAHGAERKNIVGCDLSQRMMANAEAKYSDVFFWCGDVMDFSIRMPPPEFPSHIEGFSQIFFNACFANMLDRFAVLMHSSSLLTKSGRVIVSHPAPEFVPSLHESDPEIVPHLLPTRDEANAWSKDLSLTLEHFESSKELYLAIFSR